MSEINSRDENFVPTISGIEDDGSIVVARFNAAKELLTATNAGGLNLPNYDYVGVTYPDSVTEVYTFKIGGSSGADVAIVTLVYTDGTKDNLSSVTKV